MKKNVKNININENDDSYPTDEDDDFSCTQLASILSTFINNKKK